MQITGALAVERMQRLAESGYWWEDCWDRGSPSPNPRCPDQIGYRWEDHPYMLKHRELPTIYVSEPYSLGDEDFGDMAKLVNEGWDVRIVLHKSLWNPGNTIPVWMSRKVGDRY